jgi:hypothetical protein
MGWTGFRGVIGDDAAEAATTDLINILDTVEVPIVVVLRDFKIAGFNKAAADVLDLSPSDIGRASRDTSVLAGLPRLEERCSQVITSGVESRADFRDRDKWFVVRISPYTRSDRQINGAVLTFTNVTAFRASTDQAIYEREFTKTILNTVTDPLVVLGADQRIQSGNRAFYAMFGLSRDETQGTSLYELSNSAFDIAPMRKQLKEMLAGGHTFQPVEIDHVFTAMGERTLTLDARTLSFRGHSERRVLVTFQDITERQQAEAAKDLRSEEELRRREAKIRRLVEANVVGIVMWTLDGAISEANEAFLQMVQYDREDIISGRVRWTDLTPPEWRDRDERAFVDLKASGIFQPFEKEYLRKDGSRVPVFIGGALLEGNGNQGVAFVLDLSGQKRAEEKVLKNEERTRLMLDEALDAVVTMDADGVTTGWNKQAEVIFGWAREDAVGRRMSDMIIPAQHRDGHERGLRHFLATGEGAVLNRRIEMTALARDGREFPIELSVTPLKLDQTWTFSAFIRDITERKRAEKALLASERDLSAIINTIPMLAWSTRPDGFCDFLNQRWLDYAGLTLDQALGWGWGSAVHPDDVKRLVDYWQTALASGELVDVEARMRRFDGEYRWFLFRASPLRDASGNIVKWYGTNTDIDDRKRAEKEIQARESRFRMILDGLPAFVTLMGPSGEAEFANRTTLDYFDATLEEVISRPSGSTFHPDERQTVLAMARQSFETAQRFDFEVRHRRADGVYRWFHVRGGPVRDSDGRIVLWYLMHIDIEDRKRAEEALRANERSFRLIVDTIPALVCTMTPQGEVELVNRQIYEYFGLTLEQLKNWSFVGAVAEEDLPGIVARWRHSVATGEPYDIEHRIRRDDGMYRWFHVRGLPLRDAEGRILRWYILLIDVEDRRRAEEALRASERDLSLIIETIPGMVWCAAPDGRINYLNQRLLDYSGSTVADWASAGWTNFLHPNDTVPMVEAWSKAVANSRTFEIQCRFRRSDGAYRWFQVLGEAARETEGTVTRWYGLLLDIDDRKLMEDALRTTEARLSRATQIATVGELSASIAHEINQPLAAVVASGHACVRFLSAQPPNVERAHEAAESIVRDGKEAGEVVRRIRALFKRAPVEKARLNLNEVIGEVLRLLASETAKRQVAVEADLKQDLSLVSGDRIQLQQVLLNLLLNGIEAMDSVHDRSRKLTVRSRQESPETVLVEVRDNGVGLESPDKVFEAFVTTKQNGMGMGLAICRSIVEAHNGRLWAVPAEGPGATFCFALPVRLSAES